MKKPLSVVLGLLRSHRQERDRKRIPRLLKAAGADQVLADPGLSDERKSDELASRLGTQVKAAGNNEKARHRILGAITEMAIPREGPSAEDVILQRAAIQLANEIGPIYAVPRNPTSLKARDYTVRTPNDVLVHLMSLVCALQSELPDNNQLRQLSTQGQRMFLSHTADTAAVAGLIEAVGAVADAAGRRANGKKIRDVGGRLPPPGETLAATQLQDAIYTRVFESKFAGALVRTPPPQLLDLSHQVTGAFLGTLDPGNEIHLNAALDTASLCAMDPRPWSDGVQAFQAIAATAVASTDTESMTTQSAASDSTDTEAEDRRLEDQTRAFNTIREFLQRRPETGAEMVAASYLLAQFNLKILLNNQARRIPLAGWMRNGNRKYAEILRQKGGRSRIWADDDPYTDASGITLLHQPTAEQGNSDTGSERPATSYRFGIDRTTEKPEYNELEGRTSAVKLAHENGLPYASGASGTTTLLLYCFNDLKRRRLVPGDTSAHAFLLAQMVFLTHDGGHTLHESLLSASMIDQDLNLGLGLGTADPSGFVADYDAFINSLPDQLQPSVREAMKTAWDGTQDYHNTYSAFA